MYVIDNDPSVRATMAVLIELGKFIVETFSSLSQFLSESRKDENACVVIDIETVDLRDFDLYSVAERLKIPVIVVSPSDSIVNRQRALLLGAIGFLHKPVDPQVLLDVVTWAIEGAQPDEK
jgi:two-component system, LuxR family, response regulator FixJ